MDHRFCSLYRTRPLLSSKLSLHSSSLVHRISLQHCTAFPIIFDFLMIFPHKGRKQLRDSLLLGKSALPQNKHGAGKSFLSLKQPLSLPAPQAFFYTYPVSL